MSRYRVWMRVSLVCAAIAAITFVPLTGNAQTFRGTILGSVTDTTGATVPKAKVTVRNVDTGIERTTATTDDGSADGEEAGLFLRDDAEVIAMDGGGELFGSGGIEFVAEPGFDGG